MRHPPLRFQDAALTLAGSHAPALADSPCVSKLPGAPAFSGCCPGAVGPTPQQALPSIAPALTAAVALLPFSTVAL